MSYQGSELTDTTNIQSGQVGWRSPSNIALIKYWGKHGNQLPQNPSISFTLTHAFTETLINYTLDESESDINFSFTFEGERNPSFSARIKSFLENNIHLFPCIKKLHLEIASKNSFPHSSGIASSASAMSALALCLVDIENTLASGGSSKEQLLEKSSYIARLASGSASRSVYPSAAIWGKHTVWPLSSDQYAVPFDGLHGVFQNYHDDILIVSKAKKSVSSSAGHKLMQGNVFAEARYQQAKDRFTIILDALATGDLDTFGKIVEDEALTLHALMMCSDPSYILMEPNTLAMIQRIRTYRADTKLPLYFTLDAGPNIHLLYPDEISEQVQSFIQSDLKALCEDGKIIADQIGNGPQKIASFTL